MWSAKCVLTVLKDRGRAQGLHLHWKTTQHAMPEPFKRHIFHDSLVEGAGEQGAQL